MLPASPRAVTLLTVVHGWKPDAERWLLSVFTHCKADFEAVIVDNSGEARIAGWLKGRAAERLRGRAAHPRRLVGEHDHPVAEAMAPREAAAG